MDVQSEKHIFSMQNLKLLPLDEIISKTIVLFEYQNIDIQVTLYMFILRMDSLHWKKKLRK
jgi:hypothetical protein